MIFGLGTDLIEIARFDRLYRIYGDKFVKKILCRDEIRHLNTLTMDNKSRYMAKRFSAKEALVKAMGCGIGKYSSMKDICILNDENGKPYVTLSENMQNKLISLINGKPYSISLSISDSYHIATATAIIEI